MHPILLTPFNPDTSPDMPLQMTSGPAQLPRAQLLLVGENPWPQGYCCTPTEGDPSWVALRTISGAGELTLAGSSPLTLTADSVIIFRESELLRYAVTGNHWTTRWYQFDIDDPGMLSVDKVLPAPVRALEQTLHWEIIEGIGSRSLAARISATAAFLKLLFSWIAASSESPERSRAVQIVEQAIRLMHENLEQSIPIDEIAHSVGVSGTRLRKLFATSIGKAPKSYYNWCRMYEARRLLVEGKTVRQVAAQMHYSDPFHFSRAFKNHFNRSPKSLLSQLRETED